MDCIGILRDRKPREEDLANHRGILRLPLIGSGGPFLQYAELPFRVILDLFEFANMTLEAGPIADINPVPPEA